MSLEVLNNRIKNIIVSNKDRGDITEAVIHLNTRAIMLNLCFRDRSSTSEEILVSDGRLTLLTGLGKILAMNINSAFISLTPHKLSLIVREDNLRVHILIKYNKVNISSINQGILNKKLPEETSYKVVEYILNNLNVIQEKLFQYKPEKILQSINTLSSLEA